MIKNHKKTLLAALAVISLLVYAIVLILTQTETKSIQPLQSDTKGKTQELQSETKIMKIYIDKFPYGVDKKYENSIREAMSFYERIPNVSLNFKEVSAFSEADIYVKWFKEFGTGSLGHTVNQKGIDIGLGDSNCLGKWKPYTYGTVLHIAKHELGHALGADDDYEHPDRLMYFKFSTKYETDIEEEDIMPFDLIKFYPVCTKMDVATYNFEVTSTEPLDIYVVPSKEDYELLSKRQEFKHYSNCEGISIKFYQKTCAIAKESGIVLKFAQKSDQKSSAQYKIKIKEV